MRFARGVRRAMRRGRRFVGRARTRIVKTVFESEVLHASRIIPNQLVMSSRQRWSQALNMWQSTVGGSQAVTYGIVFELRNLFLDSQSTNFAQLAQLYDYLRLVKAQLVLKPLVNPRVAVNVSNLGTGTYNFTDWPLQDPCLTYVDYDGYQPMVKVGTTGSVACPVNGDMTQLLYNKEGVRKHAPFRTIKRWFYPKWLVASAQDGGDGLPVVDTSANANMVQMGRARWQTNPNNDSFSGVLVLAIPYLGQNQAGGYVNNQINATYSICNRWYIHFKCPLYG